MPSTARQLHLLGRSPRGVSTYAQARLRRARDAERLGWVPVPAQLFQAWEASATTPVEANQMFARVHDAPESMRRMRLAKAKLGVQQKL
jgi:hypothetical protein